MCKDTKVVNFYFSMISYQPVIPYLTQMTQIRILLIRILIRYCFDFFFGQVCTSSTIYFFLCFAYI